MPIICCFSSIQVAAYCYQGQCQSHQSQCQLLWGSSSDTSVSQCYSCFNTGRDYVGNCGVNLNNLTYVSCAPRSVTHNTLHWTLTNVPSFQGFQWIFISWIYLNPIRKIRNTLDYTTDYTIATILIHSKLEFCDFLYLAVPVLVVFLNYVS